MSAAPNTSRPLREFNARKNPGIADGDTKSASVRAGFPAQRTKVESDSLRGPNERTWSHTVTECRQPELPRLRSSRLDSGQLQLPHGIVIHRRVRVEDCMDYCQWDREKSLARSSLESEELRLPVGGNLNYGIMTSDEPESQICDSAVVSIMNQPGRLSG